MTVSFKIANKEDFNLLAKIYTEEFSKPPYNEKWTQKKALKKLRLFSKYCEVYKIISNKNIVGVVIINSNHWCPGEFVFGEDMAIDSAFQNKGIGTEILKQIFELYRLKGYKKFLGIANVNSKAIKLYEKLGIIQSKENILIEKNL